MKLRVYTQYKREWHWDNYVESWCISEIPIVKDQLQYQDVSGEWKPVPVVIERQPAGPPPNFEY